jgi:hypothetical protein
VTSVDIKVAWNKKLTALQVERIVPLVRIAVALGAIIRARVQGRGESADGGDFGKWPDTATERVPIRKAGRLKKGELSRPIIGYRTRPRRVWIDPSKGFPPPKSFLTETQSGLYYVEWSTYLREIHGDLKKRFSLTGGSWAGLKVQATRKGTVRLGFSGTGPSLKERGAVVRNAMKMAFAQRYTDKEILEPSDDEIRQLLVVLQDLGEDELQRIVGGAEGRRIVQGARNRPLFRTITAGNS